jgi:TrkA domain protein
VGVVSHRSGRRELLLYGHDDPDACLTALHLSPGDTRTLAELLGATQVSEVLATVQQRLEGVGLDWVNIPAGSPFAGSTIRRGQFRTQTGVSIVAVIRGGATVPAPGPDFELQPGDVAVAVGTPEGLSEFVDLLGA